MPEMNLNKISADESWNFCLNLLLDDSISEIESNGPDKIFAKRSGRRVHLTNIGFDSEEAYSKGIHIGLVPHIRSHLEYRPDEYIFEGPLRYKVGDKEIVARCHIVLPPAAEVPQVTIAKKSTALATLDDIANKGSMAAEMLEFVKAAVAADATCILSGGTGAGKALHKDTLIPTPRGFVTMDSLATGDIVFDETGARAKVIRKYCPMDAKSYELTFSNGEKIRSSAGHLWKVTRLAIKGKGRPALKRILSDEEVNRLVIGLSTAEDKKITLDELILNYDLARRASVAKVFYKCAARDTFIISRSELLSSAEKKLAIHNSDSLRAFHSIVSSWNEESLDYREIQTRTPRRLYANTFGREIPDRAYKAPLAVVIAELLAEDEAIKSYSQKESTLEATSWKTEVLSSAEMAALGVRNHRGRLNFGIDKLSGAVDYDKANLIVDPYVLGAWLGDGISDRQNICGTNTEIRDRISVNYKLTRETWEQREFQNMPMYDWKFDSLRNDLKALSLLKNKHIPSDYIYSSREQRIELISGLIDTDGYVGLRDGAVGLGLINEQVVRAAREIVLSLGWEASEIKSKIPHATLPSGERHPGKRVYSFSFWPNELNLHVEHKRERFNEKLAERNNKSQQVRHHRLYVTEIKEIQDNPADYFCISVDSPSHLFLAGETFVPTHNTTFLEAFCKHIPLDVRIGVAEDTPELMLPHPNATYLHSVPWKPGMEEKDVATLSWVVAQFNRMRVDKLIVGETRGKEFGDFLIAANSGMEGSLTTIHANDPSRTLDKMTNFALKSSPGTPIRSINYDIASSIDLIIQLAYFKADSRYRVTAIEEISTTVGTSEAASIATNRLYTYDPANDNWKKDGRMTDELRAKFKAHNVSTEIFNKTVAGDILLAPGESGQTSRPIGLPVRRA